MVRLKKTMLRHSIQYNVMLYYSMYGFESFKEYAEIYKTIISNEAYNKVIDFLPWSNQYNNF